MVGTGVGAQLGILIKGATSLEAGYRVNKIVMDKTGTLTEGKLGVAYQQYDMLRISRDVELTDALFYRIVGAAESGSEHPLGRSIVAHAHAVLELEPGASGVPGCHIGEDFEAVPGMGIKCTIVCTEGEGVRESGGSLSTLCMVGNERFMQEAKIGISAAIYESKAYHEAQGKKAVCNS